MIFSKPLALLANRGQFSHNDIMNFSGIIFDMDGTLLDSMGLWLNAGEYYLSSLGIKAEKDTGKKLMEMNMISGAEFLKEKYSLNLSCLEICEGINNTLKEYYAEKIMLKSGVIDFLETCRKNNIPLAILTNTDRELFSPCLTRLNLTKYFSEIITCSEEHTSKNHPEIFFHTAEKINSKPENTLVIEDAYYALKTAHTAGFKTMGIYDKNTQTYTSKEKIKTYSTWYFENWKDALTLL